MGKKLTVYLIHENDNGPRTVEIGNWSGKAVYSPRANLLDIIDRPEFQKPGVYILKSDPTDDSFPERIYIGETERVGGRLKQHLKDSDKDFKEVVMFISKDEMLTKSHIKYLESRLVGMAKSAKNCELDNGNTPTESSLSEADISDMEYFLGQIKFILPVVGYSFLVPATVKIASVAVRETSRYFLNAKGFHSELVETSEGFLVLKGSTGAREAQKSMSDTYAKLRRKLLETGVILEKESSIEFTDDTVFSSLSAASTVICGRAASGPQSWKNAEGKTYKEVQESL